MSTRWEFDLIDLSRPLTEDTGIGLMGDLGGPENFRVDVEHLGTWETGNVRSERVSFFDHLGTHLDAPNHTNEDGYALERVKISSLIGEAVVLDLSRYDSDHGYTAEDLANASPRVEPGDIVLIHSGYRDVSSRTERIRQTYLTPSAAQWLVDRGVKAVGCEPGGIEHAPTGYHVHRWHTKDTPNPPSWPAHQILLRNEVYIIEGLVGLERVKSRRLRFAALPLLVPGLSGFPVRAVAWIDR